MAKKKIKKINKDFDKSAIAHIENPFDDFDESSEVIFSLALITFIVRR